MESMKNNPAELLEAFDKNVADKLEAMSSNKEMLGIMSATLRLYEDLIKWYKEGSSFEGWIELSKSYYYSDELMDLDTDGELRKIADKYFAEDLRPYFDTNAKMDDKDFEILFIKRRAFESTVKTLKLQ